MNIQRAHQRRIWLQSSINLIYFHILLKNWVKCWLISVVYSEREKETENMYFLHIIGEEQTWVWPLMSPIERVDEKQKQTPLEVRPQNKEPAFLF